MDTIAATDPRRTATPLYDARFEHDACGVGFVADAGGHSRDRVLPLALAGLAALGHRGAFGADGESSDGAGVALPLDRSLLGLLAGDARGRRGPGVVSLFLPRGRAAEARGARARRDDVRRGGPAVVAWRAVPIDAAALGASAAASRPAFAQAIVARPARAGDDPRPLSDDAFERRLVVARRRLETAARAAGGALAELVGPVRVGPDDRLQGPRHRRPAARPLPGPAGAAVARLRGLPPALRHQHPSGLAARPAVPLDRPQRRDQHGPRQPRAGPRPRRRTPPTLRDRARAAGGRAAPVPGRLRLAVARRGARAPDGDRLGSDAGAPDRDPRGARPAPRARIRTSPRCAAGPPGSSRRGTARPPSSSPTAGGSGRWSIATGCGPAAFAVTRDRLVAVASEAGAVPFSAAETVRRGRLGPGELLLVEPGRRAILEDAEAKTRALRDAADPRRAAADLRRPDRAPVGAIGRADAARTDHVAALPGRARRRARPPRHQDDGARGPRAALEHGRRHADAGPRPARPARSPTTSARRSPRSRTRRSTRSASASSWTSGSSSAAGRRSSAVRRAGRGRSRLQRPIVVDLDGPAGGGPRRPARRSATLDATWDPDAGPAGLEAALDRLAADAVAAPRARRRGRSS